MSTWISFLFHFVVDFQLNKKNVENHGNTWRVLTFVHSTFPNTGIYILNLCHKNKLNWGGGGTKLQEYELMNNRNQ